MFNIKKKTSKDIIALIRENLNDFDKLVKEYKWQKNKVDVIIYHQPLDFS